MLRAIIKQSCFFLSRQPRQQQSFYKQLKTITTGDNKIEKETNEDVSLTCKVLRLILSYNNMLDQFALTRSCCYIWNSWQGWVHPPSQQIDCDKTLEISEV